MTIAFSAGHLLFDFVELAEILAGEPRSIVVVVKIAPALQRNVHRPKIIGRDQAGFHQRRLVARRTRLAIDHKRGLPAVVAERQSRSGGSGFNARQAAKVFQQAVVKLIALFAVCVFLLAAATR